MLNIVAQQRKAKIFRDLHFNKSLLVLPNIWDPLGAALLEDLGYPAIATASASIAYTHGVADGENIKFSDLLILIKKITDSVSVPVTADIESGYAHKDEELQENIKRVLEAGVVGINIEDYDLKNKALFPVEIQCKRLQLVRQAAEKMGIPLFINARTDVYIKGTQWVSNEEKCEETSKRGKAYLEAGADGIYPITMNKKQDIAQLVSALSAPVNILAIPGIPDLKTLKEMGVARLSLGPGFLKVAIRAMKQAALQLKNGEGLSGVTENELSNDYLKKLVSRSG
jgi:2-methylisocitrate lyase-like PEP mutase family enzyme